MPGHHFPQNKDPKTLVLDFMSQILKCPQNNLHYFTLILSLILGSSENIIKMYFYHKTNTLGRVREFILFQ